MPEQTVEVGQVWIAPSGHRYRVTGPSANGYVPLADAVDPALIQVSEDAWIGDIGYDVKLLTLLNSYTLERASQREGGE
jgi:hypothetical protein